MAATPTNLLTNKRGVDGMVKLLLAGVTLAIAAPVLRALLLAMMTAAEILLVLGQVCLTFLRTGGF